jgi:hypothetical protein
MASPGRTTHNLLVQEAVGMTVLAQDLDRGSASTLAQIPVPADRLQRGPRSHRFHVVDVLANGSDGQPPVVLHEDGDPWTYHDRFVGKDPATLVGNRTFRAQNVFAVASHTLALFERHLGRPIPWRGGWPHLYLVPDGTLGGNAAYSPPSRSVIFGWLPGLDDRPEVHTSLSYDVIAHEVTHAILDGLRPRYVEPGLPDQLAFHEALADLVALFSVFTLDGVAADLLNGHKKGRKDAARVEMGSTPKERFDFLRKTPLSGLAEQLGRARATRQGMPDLRADQLPLRRSVDIEPGRAWQGNPAFGEAHRRAEVLVAVFMRTFLTFWTNRLTPLDDTGGLDVARVAEEGTKSAEHLLGMLLRALDYLPPVELEFGDVIDAVITADLRLAPDDEHHYRKALQDTFKSYGIVPPARRIVDEDGRVAAAPVAGPTEEVQRHNSPYPGDPDAPRTGLGIRYEHLNFVALRTSPEEVFQFIWSNARELDIDVRLATVVDRVLATTRVGPDGLVVNEVIADYWQLVRTTADHLPRGMRAPAGMPRDAVVEVCGGGVLVFDQFGRFRLHQRKPIFDVERQQRRLDHLFDQGLHDDQGAYGTTDGVSAGARFALLHAPLDDGW